MENSCRKKYKPSPKKWILASRYSEFRRNPALIPANAGLFHYAANNPVRYIDPDGRIDYIYSLDEEGNKTIRKENDWGKWEGFHRDRYYVETPDGERYRANSLETVIKNDWKKIDTDFLNGKFKKLIDDANEKPTGLIRVFKESIRGELDFKLQMDEDTLYFNGDVLYNPNEAGNFVWSYFLESHGFHFWHTPLAQLGTMKSSQRFDEWHDTKARWAGFCFYWKNRIKGEKQ